MRVLSPLFAMAIAAVFLAACAAPTPPAKPGFYQSLARSGAVIDAPAALSMINAYRQNKGLGPLELDAGLTAIAEKEARAMAAADRVSHANDRGNSLVDRLAAAGYAHGDASENVSAGYHTFAEAFSGWRDSRPHNATMLNANATRMGIATAYAPASKYHVFWSLIVAEPR
ncbi:MAG: CAP domain-containing protein [Hyphomicrobiales bacterium]